MAKASSDKGSIVWDGTNQKEVEQFCGYDPLGNPAANFAGRVWNENTGGGYDDTLSVYNTVAHTTFPVKVGDRIVKDDGGLRPDTDEDLRGYEMRHLGESRSTEFTKQETRDADKLPGPRPNDGRADNTETDGFNDGRAKRSERRD